MASALEARMRARETQNRAFAAAVLASMVLHGLLLFALPALRDPSKKAPLSPGPILARLLPPKPAPVAPPAEAAPKPKVEARPAEKPAVVPKPAVTPKPAQAAKPAPVPVPIARPEPLAQPKAARPAEPMPREGTAPSVSSSPLAAPRVAAQPAAPPAPEALDANLLAQYRLAVIEAAKRYKRYPRVALDNNWEGRVEVRMVIGANGMIASLSVRTSAGHEILDTQALDMIRRAKPLTPIPAALRGREFAIDIPVIFNLQEPKA